MRRTEAMRRTVVLGVVVVLLSLLPACGRREGAPTLPQPERVHLAFRLVLAQTQNPVAGAKVLVRRAGPVRRAGGSLSSGSIVGTGFRFAGSVWKIQPGFLWRRSGGAT